MKILLVYPQYPETFWSFKHALKIASKKASFPPLGLLTVAAMLPAAWEKKLVDTNVTALTDEKVKWADYVFISAMAVQQKSVREIVSRCQRLHVKVVAGGPLFTTGYKDFEGIDHFVLGEGEAVLPSFITDMEQGNARHIYTSSERPDITGTPIPLWSLINLKKYSSMNLQYSRGCPFNCEFCDIVILNGHTPRTKTKEQILAEMDALYTRGWHGSLFIVDDNFIGNKNKLKTETLPAMIQWMKARGYPFSLLTEVSINLADDDELMRLMVEAGFSRVFIGIETPNDSSLAECNKLQNQKRDLVASVKKIQNQGMEVQGGFIVGFDNDPLTIFKSQIDFIQKSGIVTAMVGLLNAPPGTRLYERLEKEKRLLKNFSGDQMDCSLNFVPKMNQKVLISGYRHILDTIYSPKQYYARLRTFLREYKPRIKTGKFKLEFSHIGVFFRFFWFIGIVDKGRSQFWRFFLSTLVRRPRLIPVSVGLAVYGYHFRKVIEKYIRMPIKDTL